MQDPKNLEDVILLDGNERTEIIFDGPNFWTTLKKCELNIDYSKVRNFTNDVAGNKARLTYFAMLPPATEHSPIRPMIDWMSYNGFNTIIDEASMHEQEDGTKRMKGNLSVHIATHMLRLAHNRSVDHIILFSGNGDFIPCIQALKELSVNITIVSSHGVANDGLRRAADNFVFIDDNFDQFHQEFGRDESEA
jgi:uncharacterized LabA/DUF88 family protein